VSPIGVGRLPFWVILIYKSAFQKKKEHELLLARAGGYTQQRSAEKDLTLKSASLPG
jgi:hypothetical protein